jgi:uncharacterized protein YqeY
MSELKQHITTAIKDAMRAREKVRLGTIRLILAELKRVEVDERTEIDDVRVLAILDKMNKQRRDSIAQFETAGRDDLAAIEREEMEVIATFLPAAFSSDEIAALIDTVIAQTGAASMQDMGKVMGVLKPQLQGRADMAAVSKLIKARLG